MKQKFRSLLAFLLVLTLAAALPLTGASAATELAADQVVRANGVYQIPAGTTGTITLAAGVKKVELIGNGASWNAEHTMVSTPLRELTVDCTAAPGVELTVRNCYIKNTSTDHAVMIDFAGTGNTLLFEGVNVLDDDVGYTTVNDAAIHVAEGSALTIGGAGTAYLYKRTQGAGIGGSTGELNGDLIFRDLTLFIKGTRQGAVIGAGSNSKGSGIPGAITFHSGVYNILANAAGAAVGGGAGSGGASEGTSVTIEAAASVNINVDWTGAAIGGAGYKKGNDSSGGTLTMKGGSLRVYIDKNATENNPTGYEDYPFTEGINNTAVTAQRLNGEGKAVYLCVFDTSLLQTPADTFNVKENGALIYSGGLHDYHYINESLGKTEQISVNSTPANWTASGDQCLYFYLTAGTHSLNVNGEIFRVDYNAGKVGTIEECTGGVFTVRPSGASEELSAGNFSNLSGSVTPAAIEYQSPAAGSFTVTCTRACTVLYTADNGVSYKALNATAVSGQEDTYSFDLPADFAADTVFTVLLKGDVDMNGRLSALDARNALEGATNPGALSPMQLAIADQNENGKISALEARVILSAVANPASLAW